LGICPAVSLWGFGPPMGLVPSLKSWRLLSGPAVWCFSVRLQGCFSERCFGHWRAFAFRAASAAAAVSAGGLSRGWRSGRPLPLSAHGARPLSGAPPFAGPFFGSALRPPPCLAKSALSSGPRPT
jgi:hypothetical protein